MKRFVSVLLVLLLMSGIGLEVFATSDEHVHTPGNWETLQEPTSEADGIQQTTCTTCNMVYTCLLYTSLNKDANMYDRRFSKNKVFHISS